jgi:hypothetical protein
MRHYFNFNPLILGFHLVLGLLVLPIFLAAQSSGKGLSSLPKSQETEAKYFPMRHQGGIQQLSPIPQSTGTLARIWGQYPAFDEQVYLALGMHRLPTENEWKRMEVLGIKFQGYMPPLAFIVAAPKQPSPELLNFLCNERSLLAACDQLFPDAKRSTELSSSFWTSNPTGNDLKGLHILLHASVDPNRFKGFLQTLPRVELFESLHGQLGLSFLASQRDADIILAHPAVQYMEPSRDLGEPEDREARSLHRGHAIDNLIEGGTRYNGAGVTVAIADDGAIGPHIDFKGRLTQYTTNTSSANTHGDMTAGIAVGSGNLNPTRIGAAYGSYLHMYGISGYPHVAGATTNYTNLGTTLTSTSYSEVNGGLYNSSAVTIDGQIRNNTMLMHVFSAGNAGTSDHGYGAGAGWGNITGGYKAAKNVLAVGNLRNTDALESSSSRGPARDGRIKPDLCANGYNQMSTAPNNTYQTGGGTSAASPSVMGTLAQISHGYRTMNNNAVPPTALLKAALLNTAEDLGNPGPDFQFGWGRINALRAVHLLQNNRYVTGSISVNDSLNHSIEVPANVRQLRVMLYWADQPGIANATKALVNDLDLRVLHSSGLYHWPLKLDASPNASSLNSVAIPGIDSLNNVEQVRIQNPTAGTYTARIVGRGIAQGPQVYWLVWEWHTDEITMTYPMGGESFVSGETEILRWDATGNTGPFTLQWSSNNGLSWTNIATNLANSVRHYSWVVPSITSGQVKIRVSSGSNTSETSQSLHISPLVTGISFPTVCSTSLILSWPAVSGAGRYVIHRLGAVYMDSISTTTSTTFTVNGTNLSSEDWYAITPIGSNNSWRGRRSNAVAKPLTGPINCTGGSVIAGNLVYANPAQNPMTNTVIILKQNGTEIARDTTDAQGQFNLGNRPPGTYTMEYQTNKLWGGVNSTDALAINRHFAVVTLLSGIYAQAADVNASNSVNSTDALTTARRFSNIISNIPAGNWFFETGSLNLISGNLYNNLQLRAVTFGDVNGSYTPPSN